MNATELVHSIINGRIGAGAFCIDATAGRGRDTAYLCELVGPCGRVIAFDIQQEAVDSTNALLAARGLRAEVHLDSHSNMANYAEPETVDCIVFNLGWLPGGDHRIFTHADTSFAAISAGLELLKKGGLMCVTIYHGGATGFESGTRCLNCFAKSTATGFRLFQLFFTIGKRNLRFRFLFINTRTASGIDAERKNAERKNAERKI